MANVEYNKIGNLFKFDAKYKQIVGLDETAEFLKNLQWFGTEKIDGTNTRVYWDGHRISLAGRTDKADIQPLLKEVLELMFLTQEQEYVFEQLWGEKEVILYGEGYGPSIQKEGSLYRNDKCGFILFDVMINGVYLNREQVEQIAAELGLEIVPIVFRGTLDEAKAFVAQHQPSTLNPAHEMEGIVLTTVIPLFNNRGKPIKYKCKYQDMKKGKLI